MVFNWIGDSVNWVYTYDDVTTAPLVRYSAWAPSSELTFTTTTFTNAELCSDKEHPLSEQYEDEEGNLVLRVALAGYPRENVSVTYADNVLVVSASKVEDEHKSLSIAKRACKKELVDSKGVWEFFELKATLKDGLLTVKVPKKKDKRPVSVSIG